MMDMSNKSKNKGEEFCKKKFLNELLTEGLNTPCDSTQYSFTSNSIPAYYDKEKFIRAKKFYNENIFGIFYAKLLGLITLFTCSYANQVLIMTNKSSTPGTAYVRYMRTIFHMNSWYNYELTRNSKSYKSLMQVKMIHNNISMNCPNHNLRRFTQKDMAYAQFGFISYVLVRSTNVGLYKISKEDLEAFVHFWRVIGHPLGMEDRFNICRENIDETKLICEEMIKRIFKPKLKKSSKLYRRFSDALLDGLKSVQPLLQPDVFRALLVNVIEKNTNNFSYFQLNLFQKFKYNFVRLMVFLLRYNFCRNLFNYLHKVALYKTTAKPDASLIMPRCLQ